MRPNISAVLSPPVWAVYLVHCLAQVCALHRVWYGLLVLNRFSCVRLFATPWTVARQDFFRQAYWSGLPCPPPAGPPHPGMGPASITSAAPAGSLPLVPPGKPRAPNKKPTERNCRDPWTGTSQNPGQNEQASKHTATVHCHLWDNHEFLSLSFTGEGALRGLSPHGVQEAHPAWD